jgi:hypothetical protein
LIASGHEPAMLNFSVRTTDTPAAVSAALAAPLLQLRDAIVHAVALLEHDE